MSCCINKASAFILAKPTGCSKKKKLDEFQTEIALEIPYFSAYKPWAYLNLYLKSYLSGSKIEISAFIRERLSAGAEGAYRRRNAVSQITVEEFVTCSYLSE